MLDLALIKQHCRLEPDFDDDNDLLETYSNAARRLVENETGRHIYESSDAAGYDEDPDALVLDDDITTALLLLVGHWYENREASITGVSVTEMPMAVQALIQPYRHFPF